MRITLGELRSVVNEELRRLHEASWQVTYTEKDGRTPGKPRIFGGDNAEKMARMYAKSVKSGVAAPVDAEAPAVDVEKVRPAGLDDLKAAAKAYRNKNWRPTGEFLDRPGRWQKPGSADEPWDAENAAEREAEMWGAAQAAGQSREDTYTDIDYERSRRRGR